MTTQFAFTVTQQEEMLDIAKTVEESILEIEKISQSLEVDILPTLDSYWTGPTKNAFVNRYRSVNEAMVQVLRTFEELTQDLRVSSDRYRTAEIETLATVNAWRRSL
ncbi:MAG: WXG100 family type VII secretion target [Erysipelotrichaceae bacterium]